LAAGKHPAANTTCHPLGMASTMPVDSADKFLHQGATNPSSRLAASLYCPTYQQEVLRILSTPILI